MRGCGSKLAAFVTTPYDADVAPMRGCGSKLRMDQHIRHARPVAPMRGCGSKRGRRREGGCVMESPPCGGVDRNPNDAKSTALAACRPHAGVWIETGARCCRSGTAPVAPMRGCGSKQALSATAVTELRVAPMRGYGSKQGDADPWIGCLPSPPCGSAGARLTTVGLAGAEPSTMVTAQIHGLRIPAVSGSGHVPARSPLHPIASRAPSVRPQASRR